MNKCFKVQGGTMKTYFKGKSILVTGAAGTVGQELVKQLIEFEPKEIIAVDNNETELFFLLQKFNGKLKGYVGNIANRDFIFRLVKGIDIVFHAAALKHVILGERSPDSIVEVNIIGLQNVLDACLANNVEKFIFTSSDKAVNPTNVMGTSKLMGERLVTATNSKKKGQKTIFCSTRFGNVIGSRGSVLPIFKNQIKAKGPLTLTDKKMTRFIMTIEESVRLIIKAGIMAEGGEVFVTKMPIMNIGDLAIVMRDELAPKYGFKIEDIKIQEIGARSGEKMYEELMSEEEIVRAFEFEELFAIIPTFRSEYEVIEYSHIKKGKKVDREYNSSNEKCMSKEEIKEYLMNNKLLEE